MRITGWHIDSFGLLRDVGVRDLPDGLVVVHGPNASGKSTTLAFIQRTLFGHPHRNRKEVNHYEPPVGGRRGGRLLCDADGEVTIERHVGRNGELRVVLPNGSVGGEDELAGLTGGCDDQLFNAVFAFGLDELRSITSLTDEAVRDHLFSAGVRGAGRSARAVRERLDSEARALWTPRTRSAEVDVLQGRLEEVTAELEEARRTAASYPERLDTERACREEVDRLSAQLESARADARRAETLLAAWPVWVRRQQASEELTGLAETPEVPDDALERLEALSARLDAARDRLTELEEEHRDVAERRDGREVDDALASVAEEAQALDEDRTAQRERLQRLRVRESERAQLEEDLAAILGDLGGDWDAERLLRTDVSVPVRGELRVWQQRIASAQRKDADAEREATEAQERRSRAQRARERADQGVAEAVGETPPLAREEIDERRSRLGELRAALAERDAARAELTASERLAGTPRWAPPRWLGPSVAAVAAVGAAASGLMGAVGTAAVLGVLAAVFMLGALALPGRRPTNDEEDPVAPALARSERAAAAVVEPAAALGFDEEVTALDVERRAADLDRAARNRAELDRLWTVARDAAEEVADEDKALERARAIREAARDELEQTRSGWAEWCAGRDFDPDSDPTAIADLFAAVDRGRERRERLAEVDRDIGALRDAVHGYADRAARALAEVGRDPVVPGTGDRRDEEGDPARFDLGALERQLEEVRRLAGDAAEDRARRAERDRLTQRLGEIDREQAQQRSRRGELEEELSQLLATAGADDAEGFRVVVSRARRRQELAEQMRHAGADLEAQLGAGADAEELRAELASGDRASWEAACDEAQRRMSALGEQRDQALEALHRAERERAEVETSERVAELDHQRQALLAQRDALVHDWRVATVARVLVGRTLDGYERERQPKVLRHASERFASTTDGAYTGLLQQGDELLVRDAGGSLWSVDKLSRGTAEQLYLCLRLALAEDLASRQAPLPFVMDDVLVNFDPERAQQVARLLAEVAKEGQVLYFTCHPHTVEMLQEAGAAGVYDLPRGGGVLTSRIG